MGADSNYKKLLLQRNVLDTFRVYLEVTEDFLNKLKDAKILTNDELMVVKVTQLFSFLCNFLKFFSLQENLLNEKPCAKDDQMTIANNV